MHVRAGTRLKLSLFVLDMSIYLSSILHKRTFFQIFGYKHAGHRREKPEREAPPDLPN